MNRHTPSEKDYCAEEIDEVLKQYRESSNRDFVVAFLFDRGEWILEEWDSRGNRVYYEYFDDLEICLKNLKWKLTH